MSVSSREPAVDFPNAAQNVRGWARLVTDFRVRRSCCFEAGIWAALPLGHLGVPTWVALG